MARLNAVYIPVGIRAAALVWLVLTRGSLAGITLPLTRQMEREFDGEPVSRFPLCRSECL